MGALDDPALAGLWDAVAERLQRNGLSANGVVTLVGLGRAERYALAGLVGRPIDEERARIDLAVLDARLRLTGSAGLVATVTSRRGPLTDRRGERATAAAARAGVWAAARTELAAAGLAGEPWAEPWLEAIRPIANRVPAARARVVVASAVRCLARLATDELRCGRTELANRVAGSSHALDDGTVLAALVLRAVAILHGLAPAETPAQRRSLWERAGVLTDEVSTTVLTLGLHPSGPGPAAASVRARSDARCEVHLTIRDLRRLDRFVAPGSVVWVCENPRVLEAAMDSESAAAMVCTSGNPTVVTMQLLERLACDGARLRYRGDFDWPGVAIANRVIGGYSAQPWRMGSADYEAALVAAGTGLVELPKLDGRPVAASWDPALAPAMERAGWAIHEEAMLDLLVADLAG